MPLAPILLLQLQRSLVERASRGEEYSMGLLRASRCMHLGLDM
jgi:hypothetical protein